MYVDSSENRDVVVQKSDSNGSNNATLPLNKPCANNDKKDSIESECGKEDNLRNEETDRKLPSNSDPASSHQIPKSEFPFREASSSANNDSNNKMSDISTESNTALESDIKVEGPGTDAPLPPYAVSKLQVSFRKEQKKTGATHFYLLLKKLSFFTLVHRF